MSSPALDIPEDANELATWLEAMLTSGDLRRLVAQLSSLPGAEAKGLDEVLDRQLPAVLERGLSIVQNAELRGLLASPVSLLELQEAVMVAGSEYWQAKFLGSSPIVEGTKRVIVSLQDKQLKIDPLTSKKVKSTFAMPLSALALAATVVLAIFGVRWWIGEQQGTQLASGWGWMKASDLPSDLSAEEYLEKLSAGADAWSNKRPQNNSELTQRLSEFKTGCEILIAADHKPLSEEDRNWLLYKCRGWRTKLDSLLAASRSGEFIATLEESDSLAADIAMDLAARAERIAG